MEPEVTLQLELDKLIDDFYAKRFIQKQRSIRSIAEELGLKGGTLQHNLEQKTFNLSTFLLLCYYVGRSPSHYYKYIKTDQAGKNTDVPKNITHEYFRSLGIRWNNNVLEVWDKAYTKWTEVPHAQP